MDREDEFYFGQVESRVYEICLDISRGQLECKASKCLGNLYHQAEVGISDLKIF